MTTQNYLNQPGDLSEREMLVFAAKAAGIPGEYQQWFDSRDVLYCGIAPDNRPGREWWNPLRHDGEALQLAVKLRLDVMTCGNGPTQNEIQISGAVARTTFQPVAYPYDAYAATRLAITRAAAAIGEQMK